MLDMATSNLPDLSSSRNGASPPIFDSSGSDVLAVSQTGNNRMSKSFTNSDSALPLSYSSTPFAPRAPSLPPSNTSKYSTSSDTNIAPPEVPIRTTSSPKKNASLPLFIGREWVLEKFSRWLQLSSDNTPVSTEAMSCTFIVLGGPGAGKTSLFNQIIRKDCLGISNQLLAYHACSNQFAATLNLPRFILSLRDQLIARQDSIGAFYKERISANGGRLNRLFTSARMCAFPDEVLSEGIFKVLSDLDTRQIGSEQKLFFAIDAADECLRFNPTSEVRAPPSISSIGCSHKRLSQASSTSDHANEFQSLNLHQSSGRIRQGWVSRNLLELLAVNALFLPPWIGIFITCRRDSQTILRRLFRCASTAFLDDTRCPLVVKDLNDYVLSRVKNDPLLSNIFSFCGHETLQVLQYKSNGSILYLHIVLSAVSEGWLTPEYIKTIPGTINGLFLWLSQRLLNPIPNDPSTLIMTVIKPILNLVLTTPRPLTLTETDVILQANNVSPKILENWKQVLFQPFFLTHDYPVFLVQQQPQQWIDLLDYADLQHERVLSLAHTSLRDWYLDVKYSTPVYLASSRDGHTMLALAALSQIKRTPGLSHSFTWDILYNFARSSLYNSPEAIQKLTSALRDVELDFTVDTLANLDCWMFLHDPILVHCSFAGSSISQLIEDALNYEHRTFEPQLGLQTCNGTRNLDRKPKQVLLRTGADKETSIGQLCTAAFQGKLDVVKSILAQASVDIESRDAAGSTPLVLAARQGNLEIVKCLLDARARLDQIDQDGWSALRSAAWGGHYGQCLNLNLTQNAWSVRLNLEVPKEHIRVNQLN
ncbi:unnamed protein product [Hymenolepis diminuta]|uniref:ANK_REP_REGION domain-containing protein n=1 Tax=Hymenolepis diminuta TaxID=6216 RepID=A0A0R3SS44_HYMDI|nr:unnamed protein product [Hymenolepis diminuta]